MNYRYNSDLYYQWHYKECDMTYGNYDAVDAAIWFLYCEKDDYETFQHAVSAGIIFG